MSPIIHKLHSPGGSVFSMFIAELTSVLQSLKVHEVRLGDVNNILTIRSYLMNRVSLKGVGVNAGAFALP